MTWHLDLYLALTFAFDLLQFLHSKFSAFCESPCPL